ncbi:MAG: aspartate-alanine antiporter [Ignavibacteriaceae bacterium]
MNWIIDTLRTYPELALFFTLGAGFWIGNKKFGNFSLGPVTSVLLVGVLVGQLNLTISPNVKSVFFLMFLFAVGFGVGPQFFRGLKKDGIPQVIFASIMSILCLLCTWGAAAIMGYNMGQSAGLLSGANTISAVIGVAANTVNSLGLPAAQTKNLLNAIPVCYAVTYIFGTFGAILIISSLGPAMLGGLDKVKKQCKELESKLGGGITSGEGGVFPADDRVLYNAYEIGGTSEAKGKKVSELEILLEMKGHHLFVERIRHNGKVVEINKDTILQDKDVIVVEGRKEFLLGEDRQLGKEVYDVELLDFPVEKLSVLLTSKEIDGKNLSELRKKPYMHGVVIRSIKRIGIEIPVLQETILDKGDMIELEGLKKDVEKAIHEIGYVDRPTDKVDMVLASLGIFLGGLIGALTLHIGKVPLSLTTSGGALIGGLIFGWLHSSHPNIGAIPEPTLWFMNKIGLCTFIAVVGIMAGPSFVEGFEKIGPMLFVVGIVVTTIPLLIGIFMGRYLFKFHPAITLGCLAGSRVITAALGATQDTLESKTPALGYTVTYAVGNTLLIIWGVVIVLLMNR